MQTDNFILEKNKKVINYLGKYVLPCLIHTISRYLNGFVEIGKLDDEVFRQASFIDNDHISCKIKYVHHSRLYFFNFWKMCEREYGNYGRAYLSGWWNEHHMYIVNMDKKKLLYDKIRFFIGDSGFLISNSDMDPMYKPQELIKEHFETYDISDLFISQINALLINLKKIYTNDLNNLAFNQQLFRILEGRVKYPYYIPESTAENTKLIYEKEIEKEKYYENIIKPYIF